jgi:plasmid stabilization system protein ParE
MKRYTIQWSGKAERELDEIVTGIIHHAPKTIRRWSDRLKIAIQKLKLLPTRCSIIPEAKDFGIELRELTFGKHRGTIRIFFRIEGDEVKIDHIRRAVRGPLKASDFQ